MRKNPPFLKTFLTIFTDLVQGNHNRFFFPRFSVFLGLPIEGFEMPCNFPLRQGRMILVTQAKRTSKKIFNYFV